jgi:hypothetical protein
MTATLVLNADLGNYSSAVGSAQRLSNGNFSFDSGWQGQPPNQFAQTIEVLPDGTRSYVLEVSHTEFRTYRMRTLYEGVSDQLGGGPAPASDSRGSSVAAPVFGRAELDARGNGLRGSTGTSASHAEDIDAAVTLALIAPRKQLAMPTVLPKSLPDSAAATLAPDRTGVPPVDGTGATCDSATATVTGRAARDALFGKLDLDLADWGDLTETIVVLAR